MVESEKFGRIQEFQKGPYKVLAGSAGAVWYKVLVTAFMFEHAVSVTSQLGYQTKQRIAPEVDRGIKTGLFINTARVFETVTKKNIQVRLSKRR